MSAISWVWWILGLFCFIIALKVGFFDMPSATITDSIFLGISVTIFIVLGFGCWIISSQCDIEDTLKWIENFLIVNYMKKEEPPLET